MFSLVNDGTDDGDAVADADVADVGYFYSSEHQLDLVGQRM